MRIVFTATATAMETAANVGFPIPVRQAERVCVQESVTALTEKRRTSFTSVSASEGLRARKMIRTAGPAKKKSPSAQGTETTRVTKSAYSIRRRAFFLLFSASPCTSPAGTAEAADTGGTLAAAMP